MKYFSLLTVLGLLGCFNVNAMQKHEISNDDEKKPKPAVQQHHRVQDLRLEEFIARTLQTEINSYCNALYNGRILMHDSQTPNNTLEQIDMIMTRLSSNINILSNELSSARNAAKRQCINQQQYRLNPHLFSILNTQNCQQASNTHIPILKPNGKPLNITQLSNVIQTQSQKKTSGNKEINKQTQEAKDGEKVDQTSTVNSANILRPNPIATTLLTIPLTGIEQRKAQLPSLAQQSSDKQQINKPTQAASDTPKADQSTQEQDSEKK